MNSEAWFGFLGVLVGSAIPIAYAWIGDKRNRNRSNTFSAVRIIAILEEYSDKCVDVVYDDGTCEGMPARRTESGEYYHQTTVKAPDPPHFPEDIDWRNLEPKIMQRILALPSHARKIERKIEVFAKYVASPPDYAECFEERRAGYASLGLESVEIIEGLRQRYKIREKEIYTNEQEDWNQKKFFEERSKKSL